MKTTVFFDLETAGLEMSHPNIQLAAVAVDPNWKELATFQQKILFDERLADPQALAINHYDREVWKREGASAGDTVTAFSAFLKPYCCIEKVSAKKGTAYNVARLAGHNAQSFDFPRLQFMFNAARAFLPAEFLVRDTLQCALWWFDRYGLEPKNFKLSTLAEYFGIPVDGAHDALFDVRLSIAVAKRMTHGLIPEEQQEVASGN